MPAVCGFLLLAVVLVFGQTIRHDFVNYDDDFYVYENPQVADGLTAQGIVWAFTTNQVSNWHPLTWLSYLLDSQLYGMAPWGYHLTNMLLHAATAILLFMVLRQMTGDLWPSAFVAAVFAIHPLRVESVAWVAERKDVLSGLFFTLTLGAYVGYVRRPFSLGRYLAVAVLFVLGLMAKPMLVTLPLVLLLLDYWPLGRMTPSTPENRSASVNGRTSRLSIAVHLVVEKIPLLMLATVSCMMTLWAQRGSIESIDRIPLSLRIGNAAVSYVAYLGQFFYPSDLAVLYPHPKHSLPFWEAIGAILLLGAICGVIFFWRRRSPYLLVGWLWYVGMLVPVIGLVQVGLQARADRYTYLTQIGISIALAWGVRQVVRTLPYRGWACGVAATMVLTALMACSWRQTAYWCDSMTLWNHTLACTSRNYLAHNNLGIALAHAGRQQEAIKHYNQSLKINPQYGEAYNNLANQLSKTGRHLEAVEYFRQALKLLPNHPRIYNNLGCTLFELGRLQEAIEYYQRALRLKPKYAKVHNNLGKALTKAGRLSEAVKHYEQALKIKPNFAEAHNNLGVILLNTDRLPEAIEHFQRAIQLQSDYLNAYYNLALTYDLNNRPAEAIAAAQKALDIARTTGNTTRTRQIEDWFRSHRARSGAADDKGK